MKTHGIGVANAVVSIAVVSWLAGCKRTEPLAMGDAIAVEPPVEFVGRCINETSGVSYHSIYFFPKKGEMFFYSGSEGVIRVPVSVTQQAPRRVDFTFRWTDGIEKPATTN